MWFPRIREASHPTVVTVTFFVSPPTGTVISPEKLAAEKTPAVGAYDLAEYYLMLIDIVTYELIPSGRQVCATLMKKIYSDRPRIQLDIMTWENHAKLKILDTLHAATESECSEGPLGVLQPIGGDYGRDTAVCEEPVSRFAADGTAIDSRPLARSPGAVGARKKTPTAKQFTALDVARRRQPGKGDKRRTKRRAVEGRRADSLDAPQQE